MLDPKHFLPVFPLGAETRGSRWLSRESLSIKEGKCVSHLLNSDLSGLWSEQQGAQRHGLGRELSPLRVHTPLRQQGPSPPRPSWCCAGLGKCSLHSTLRFHSPPGRRQCCGDAWATQQHLCPSRSLSWELGTTLQTRIGDKLNPGSGT